MLECLKSPVKQLTVSAGPHQIHTIVTETPEGATPKPPLVLVHGFGGGVGLWANNFDELSQHYTVYAIDVLGFGRSSRPPFVGSSPIDAQKFFVSFLEDWRQSIGLDKFTLLGHSLGGYIAASYALNHADKVDNLILAAPFGVAHIPKDVPFRSLPLKFRLLKWFATRTSPQTLVRVAGPFGPGLMTRLRGAYDNARYNFKDNRVIDYVYHLNAGVASAEHAFMLMSDPDAIGFARNPLFDDLKNLTVPVTWVYGDRDFIEYKTALELKPYLKVPSKLYVIEGAAHHAYATHPVEFHAAILGTGQEVA